MYILFTYQKTLLHTLFCWFLKSPKAFSVSLNLKKSDVHKTRANNFCAINDDSLIEKHFKETYPEELELRKEIYL